MPIVTALEVQKKNKQRVNVYIDEEFFCGMESVSALAAGLKVGKEISEEQLKAAVFDSEVNAAFAKAVDHLARSMKTEKQLSDYLLKKGFDADVVEATTEKLKGYRYLDDEYYAKLYAEQKGKTKGARLIRQELLSKGIGRRTADELSEATDPDREKENAELLAEKYMRNKVADVNTLAKLQRYLLSRGYDYDTVGSVLNKYKE